jgi:hypothetical protein
MESAEKHQNVLLQDIPFTNRDASFDVVFCLCESLIDDITMLNAAESCGPKPVLLQVTESSFPIDRTFTTRIGF